jgi:hypothetical protein
MDETENEHSTGKRMNDEENYQLECNAVQSA